MTTQAPMWSTPHSPRLLTPKLNLAGPFNGPESNLSRVIASNAHPMPSTHQRCSPGPSEIRSPSPNYFGLITEPMVDSRNSDARSIDPWSPSFFLQNADVVSPKCLHRDSNSAFEAFRKQMEVNHGLGLGHSKLSLFASSSMAMPRPKLEKRSAKCDAAEMPSPKIRSPMRSVTSSALMAKTSRHENDPHNSPAASGSLEGKEKRFITDFTRDEFLKQKKAVAEQFMLKNVSASSVTRNPLPMLPRNQKVSLSPPHISPQEKPLKACTDADPCKPDDGPVLISATKIREMIETLPESAFLLLDLRVFPLYSQSHIKGALNLCIPTTLLKRPSFNLQKLKDTFSNENEKNRFCRWQTAKFIVVYDSLSNEKDTISAVNTLKKFSAEGWQGSAYILQGGFQQFVKDYPNLVDHRSSEATQPSKVNLSLGTSSADVAPLAGGCLMPVQRTAANPFFSNIRQNQDLIGGVGQIDVKLPEKLTSGSLELIPKWLLNAAEVQDHGMKVSSKYLRLEQEELATMTKALSSGVLRDSTPDAESKTIKLAGIEKGEKNRYNNIWPYEHSRVKLQGRPDGACDYVNASYLKASRSNKRYIASQGPLPATFEDFWSVIWDQDVRVIVMLTAEVENGQLKCHSYWSSQNYGALAVKVLSEKKVSLDSSCERDPSHRRANTVIDLTQFMREVTHPSTTDTPHVIIRKLALSHSAYPFSPIREITQVHYSSWPDFGAPACPSQVLGVVKLVNIMQRAATSPTRNPQLDEPEAEDSRPMLVHCSAGCGRTGTFCTIDSVIDMLKRQRKEMRSNFCPADGTTAVPENNCSVVTKLTDVDGSWIWDVERDLVEQTVKDFRSQRLSMVQNLRQFVLCYETILEWVAQQVTSGQKPPLPAVQVAPAPAPAPAISFGSARDRCSSVW